VAQAISSPAILKPRNQIRRGKIGFLLDRITVHGARQHNLKNIDVSIPRNTFTVITGLSGSGKSSLAFDTIYAEGQRRYVETLSPYARQFLDQMERPEVDSIDGLSPAISIEQKTTSRSPRSTVGTITEIYDYLRVFYAAIGVPHCPNCGHEISRQTSEQILEQVLAMGVDQRIMILAPIVRGRKGEYKKELEKLQKQGFTRARIDGVLRAFEEEITLDKRKNHTDRSGRRSSARQARHREAPAGFHRHRYQTRRRIGASCRGRRRGENFSRRSSPVPIAARAFRSSSRAPSPSTVPSARAKLARDSAAAGVSIPSRSSSIHRARCSTAASDPAADPVTWRTRSRRSPTNSRSR
jgi:hypothetical protein